MDQHLSRSYAGDFVAWNGGCLLIGSGAGVIAPHSHYAIQLALGVPGLRVQFGRAGTWQACAGALVPSRATHTIDVAGCLWSAVIFIEPETPEGRALALRLKGALEVLDAAAVEVAARRLERAWRTERSPDAVRSVCLQWVRELSNTVPREPCDPRIVQAVDLIRARLDDPMSLEELARCVHLSPSRFRHLFVEQTGMALRTYILWRRLLHVWELLMEGENLSSAAHLAGFADSAHLSRTAKTMFGLPPSLLKMSGPLSCATRAPVTAG
jgi:AraC family transcriptional regulator